MLLQQACGLDQDGECDSGGLGDIEQGLCTIALVEEPEHGHLFLIAILIAADSGVESALTELRFTIGELIDHDSVFEERVQGVDEDADGLLNGGGRDEIEVIEGVMVLWKLAVLAAHQETDRQVESGRAELALVVTVGRERFDAVRVGVQLVEDVGERLIDGCVALA